MDEGEEDVPGFMSFPKGHWSQFASTNPLERVHKEVMRHANVVGIFPNEATIIRLVGALVREQSDAWQVTRRYMTLETVARGIGPEGQTVLPQLEEATCAGDPR